MKKNILIGLLVGLTVVAFTSCDVNIFSALDNPQAPGAADLESKAAGDPDGFLTDVKNYLDEGTELTDEQKAAMQKGLTDIYKNADLDKDTREKAAVAAGELAIYGDGETKKILDNTVSAMTDVLTEASSDESGGDEELKMEDVVTGIFGEEEVTAESVDNIFSNLSTAADAYESISDPGDMDSSINTGEVAQNAVVAIGAKTFYDAVKDSVGEENAPEEAAKIINEGEDYEGDVDFSSLESQTDSNDGTESSLEKYLGSLGFDEL